VTKGILTEEEVLLLLKGRENDIQLADKKVKKAAKLSMSDAIDNATLYGDIRLRGEHREGTGVVTTSAAQVDSSRDRARYKLTFGVKTNAGDFYTDLALAMGQTGRSDNASFGKNPATAGLNEKENILVKRAMVGWNATDWLTLEAGRMENPLYTTPMVWDADLTVEGLTEKVKYKMNDTDFFLTALQASYRGDRVYTGTGVGANPTTELFAYQGGARYQFNDHTSAKAGLTYTIINHNLQNAAFKPDLSTDALTGNIGVNDLDTIEVPAEADYMVNSSIGVRLYGDYVVNTSGTDRFNSAVATTTALADRNKVSAAGNDDTAWLLGFVVDSANDFKSFEGNKLVKGDWQARLWYQDVGAYSVDQNAVDSDIFDSRVNIKGTTFKAQYNVQDNVAINFAYGHATRKNGALATAVGSGNDIGLNLSSFDLVQLDLTYKF
jgi:hypothetical protein